MQNKQLRKKIAVVVVGAIAVALTLVGCSEPEPHEHSFRTRKSNETEHWYECECGEKSSVRPHDWSDWQSDDESHWKECVCGEKSSVGKHIWSESTEEPTLATEGKKIQTCDICSKQEDLEAIPQIKFDDYPFTEDNLDELSSTLRDALPHISDETITLKINVSNMTQDVLDKINDDLNSVSGYFEYKNLELDMGGSECSSYVSYSAPSDCYKSLVSVTMPKGIKTISDNAFVKKNTPSPYYTYYNPFSKLREVKIPDGVTTIGEGAFRSCKVLMSVEIPSSVTTIGESAFNGCEVLENIEIPSSVTTIGESAFSGCKALANVNIPDGVTKIELYTFLECSKLRQIEIPKSVTEINVATVWMNSFDGCEALESVIFEDPENWQYSWYKNGMFSIDDIDVTDPTANASYLRAGKYENKTIILLQKKTAN